MAENDDVQKMAQEALKQQETNDYEKRLAEKRAKRARVSSVGIDNPFDIPKEFLDKRFHYALFNDTPGHISEMENHGYELVKDKALAAYLNQKAGDPIKFPTGMSNPAWCYLMRIEEELFQEDQKSWQERTDEQMGNLGKEESENKELFIGKESSFDGVNIQKPNEL